MRQFTTQQTVGIYRQSYASGKSTFGVQQTTTGYLRSLSPEVAASNGFQYGYAYEVIFEYGANVKTGDKFLIGAQWYTAKGVTVQGTGRMASDFTKALATLPEA